MNGDKNTQLCTFRVADLFCGVRIGEVREILRFHELTPVPLAPPEVTGLINIRGLVVPAIDMRVRLQKPKRSHQDNLINVVVQDEEQATSLIVDTIEDVIDVGSELYEAAPQTLSKAAQYYLRGVYKLDVGLLLELDVGRVTDVFYDHN